MVRLRGRVAVVSALACAAIAIAACGGDDGSEPAGPDPATLVPADAVVYAEAVVQSGDDPLADAEDALERLLGVEDAGAVVREQVDDLFGEDDPGLTSADIEPWLAGRAGAFFTTLEDEPDGALVLPASDEAEAQAALAKVAETEGRRGERTFEGVGYTLTKDDSALAVIDGFAVFGSEPGLKAAIEATKGDSLADSEEFEDATGDRPDGSIVTAYTSGRAILDALVETGELSRGQRAAIPDAGVPEGPVGAFAGTDENELFVELTLSENGDGSSDESDLLERLPEDAWVALALPDLDASQRGLVELVASDPGAAGLLDRLRGEGADSEAIAAALGAGAGYVSGASVFGIGAGVVFEVADESVAVDLLDRLGKALAGERSVRIEPGDAEGEVFSIRPADVPVEFPFTVRDGHLAAGLGEASVEQLLDPESSLTDADAYASAEDSLGDDFAIIGVLDFEPLVKLLGGIPDTANDPDLRTAMPYLERLDLFAIGKDEGGGVRLALRVDGGGE